MSSENACGGTIMGNLTNMKFRLGRLAAHRCNCKPFQNDVLDDLGSHG